MNDSKQLVRLVGFETLKRRLCIYTYYIILSLHTNIQLAVGVTAVQVYLEQGGKDNAEAKCCPALCSLCRYQRRRVS